VDKKHNKIKFGKHNAHMKWMIILLILAGDKLQFEQLAL